MGKISDGGEVSLSYFQRKIATRVLAGYLEDVWFIYIFIDRPYLRWDWWEISGECRQDLKQTPRAQHLALQTYHGHNYFEFFSKVIVFTKINFSEDNKWSSLTSLSRNSNKKLQRFFKASLVTLVAVFSSFLQNFVFTYVSVAVFIRNATSKTS